MTWLRLLLDRLIRWDVARAGHGVGGNAHQWRPCLFNGRPARTCGWRACGVTEVVSVAEFYATFGFMPVAGPAVRDAPGLRGR